MNVFSKKQIIRMMRDYVPLMRKNDRRKLSKQLDTLHSNKSIEAAWELAVGWCLSRNFKLNLHYKSEISSSNPDIEITDLGYDKNILIEVKSPSGNSFSFKDRLDKISTSIFTLSNTIRPGSGDLLRITYEEWRRPGHPVAPRVPAVTDDVASNPDFISRLEEFLSDQGGEPKRNNIDGVINALFEKTTFRYPILNYHCRIPNNPQSVINNFSSSMIADAKRQLIPFRESHILGLIVCDGGSSFISDPTREHGPGTVSGAEIMEYIIDETGIDFICFVGRVDTYRRNSIITGYPQNPNISFSMLCNYALHQTLGSELYEKLKSSILQIPAPRLHPYQAKSLTEQANRGFQGMTDMLPTRLTSTKGGNMTISISSTGLLRLLNGSISENEANYIRESINKISRIHSMKIKSLTVDEQHGDTDDDYVVIELIEDDVKKTYSVIDRQIE